MKNFINKIKSKFQKPVTTVQTVIAEKRAEGYIDTAVKIIIGVVIGGVLLAHADIFHNCGIKKKVVLGYIGDALRTLR